ncbi:hypothetical protein [Actinosynnema sp. NPDC020468]|uniref:hypothetical protein n=1 Tax=Actinosynnema sp. NPDC020468 TaxID=3154488 RepID=UPI0033D97263
MSVETKPIETPEPPPAPPEETPRPSDPDTAIDDEQPLPDSETSELPTATTADERDGGVEAAPNDESGADTRRAESPSDGDRLIDEEHPLADEPTSAEPESQSEPEPESRSEPEPEREPEPEPDVAAEPDGEDVSEFPDDREPHDDDRPADEPPPSDHADEPPPGDEPPSAAESGPDEEQPEQVDAGADPSTTDAVEQAEQTGEPPPAEDTSPADQDAEPTDGATTASTSPDDHSLMGTRRQWREVNDSDSDIPAPPKEPGDATLVDGSPIYHNAHSTTVGYDERTLNNAAKAKPEDGYHDVVVHGNPQGYFTPGSVNAYGHNISPSEVHPNHLADAVRGNPNWDGGPVRLLSCFSGTIEPGSDGVPAGQALSDALGVEVKAPTSEVGVRRFGNAPEEPKLMDGGRWETFRPREKS